MAKEELEKEADDYADKHAFRVPYDGSNKFYDDADFKASKEGYLAGAKPREKRIKKLKQKNKRLEEHIDDLKDYVLKVSKFLHNNNNTRPDALAYKERDMLLIKELELFEKWESQNDIRRKGNKLL